MLERLTDWRTTILGLALAALIIAALVTRPEWGAADLATFASAIGVVLLGALSRSGAASQPEKPADKPSTAGPIAMTLMVLTLALMGCSRPLDTAVRTVNGAREAGVLAHDVIEAVCLPAYRNATRETLPKVEATCGKAVDAYRVYTAAHVVAVVAVQRAELGIGSEADALAAAVAVGRAGAALATAVKGVSP